MAATTNIIQRLQALISPSKGLEQLPATPIQTDPPKLDAKKEKQRLSQTQGPVFKYQTQLDIALWRSAWAAAVTPNSWQRWPLYRLYREALIDNELLSQIQTLTRKVTGSPFVVIDTNTREIDIDKGLLFQRAWFMHFMELAMESIFWGHSLIELGQQDANTVNKFGVKEFSSCQLIPREFVRQEFGIVTKNQQDQQGYLYRQEPLCNFLVEVGEPFDLGLLLTAVPEVHFKRNARNDHANYSERFGTPVLGLLTDETDKTELDNKERFLANFGRNGYYMGNKSLDQINFIETNKTNGEKIFESQISYADNQIVKLISGQSMTSELGQNGSRSAGEVLERIYNEIVEHRLRWLQNHINEHLIPKLTLHGYPLEGNIIMFNKFLKEYMNPGASALQELDTETPNTPGKDTKPKDTEASLANFIQPESTSHLSGREAIASHITAMRNIHSCCSTTQEIRVLELEASLYTAFNELLIKYAKSLWELFGGKTKLTDKGYRPFLQELTNTSSEILTTAFEKSYKESLGNPFELKDENFIKKAKENLFAFSGAKSVNQLITMRDACFNEGKVVPFTDFRKIALSINKEWNQTWLRTEYDSVLQSANMASKWQDIEASKKQYPYLQYKTVGDAQVRLEHQSLEGIIRPVNDSFWDSYYPPNGWNCRCTVIQLAKAEPTKDSEAFNNVIKKAAVEPYFLNNVGKTGRTFDKQHKYFTSIKDDRPLNTLAKDLAHEAHK